MTPQEAIETIKIAIAEVEWNYPMDYAVAFEMAIEALEKQERNAELDRMIDWCKNKLANEKKNPFGLSEKRKEGYEQAMLSVMSYLHSKKRSDIK